MCETVDVFAENYTIIDWEIHELWLDGLSANEAISYLAVWQAMGAGMSQDEHGKQRPTIHAQRVWLAAHA